MNITLLGAGAWGTALAMALSHRHPVMLWSRDAQAVEAMRGARQNARYLPGMVLPEAICISADLHEVIAHAKGGLLIVASSVAGLRPLASMLATHDVDNLVWLCKGLEEGTALLPHQVVHQVLGRELPAGALSGPSFAQE
ncbi:MAG: glycerol-3-phosphate dehydrogenase, partial [Pseudomonadota bacterium]